MPAELVGLMTLEHYHFLMGGAGCLSAFTILIIWARGL